MPYDLSLLGSVDLTGSDGQPVLSLLHQPKRIAFLAYLATAPSGSRTRQEVLDLLWPDADRDRARHALSQTAYYVRRSLGKDALLNGGEALALNPDVIHTDVSAFRQSLGADRPADAIALYRGQLLQGLLFDADPEVERWLDGAREALHRKALDALVLLAREAEAAGDFDAAVRWAEHGVALSPLQEEPNRCLLAALMAADQPVRARQALERFRERLRTELEMEPSAQTVQIVEAPVVETPVVEVPAPTAPAAEDDRAPAATLPAGNGTVADPAPASRPGALAAGPSRPGRFARGRWAVRGIAVAGVVALAGLVGVVAWSTRWGTPPVGTVPPVTQRVGVFPFTYRGRPELAYLAEGLPELLSISAGGLAGISTVDPRVLARSVAGGDGSPTPDEVRGIARRYGAGHFVVGSLLEVGGHIQVTAEFHDTNQGRSVTVSDRAEREADLFGLVDDIVRRLVAEMAAANSSQLVSAAALTTHSLPALRHFLQGEQTFRAGMFPDAMAAFDAATTEDSTFALAFYRGAVASLWSEQSDFDAARAKLAKARNYRARVSAREGTLFDALGEFLEGHLQRAETLYESVLAQQPENLEAWFQLGETRFHYGPLAGRDVTESEEAWRRILATSPDNRAALIHLSAIAARKGDPGLDTLEAHLTASGGDSAMVPQIRALPVFSSGSEAERVAFLAEMGRLPADAVASTASYVARFLHDMAAAERIAGVLTADTRSAADRAEGYGILAFLAVARGRVRAADNALAAEAVLDPGTAELHRLLLAAIPAVSVERRAGGEPLLLPLALTAPSASPMPVHVDGSARSALLVYGRALSYARAGGEDGALLAAARSLTEGATPPSRSFPAALAHALTAERYLARGEDDAARQELATISSVDRWYELLRASWLCSLVSERFLLAELEIHRGGSERARGVLESLVEASTAEVPYLGPSLVRLAEIRERDGDVEGARESYRNLLDLWSEADPGFAPVLAEIRTRIEALPETNEGS